MTVRFPFLFLLLHLLEHLLILQGFARVPILGPFVGGELVTFINSRASRMTAKTAILTST